MALFKNKRILVLYALVFAFALFTVSVKPAQAANLYFSPASGSYTIGLLINKDFLSQSNFVPKTIYP